MADDKKPADLTKTEVVSTHATPEVKTSYTVTATPDGASVTRSVTDRPMPNAIRKSLPTLTPFFVELAPKPPLPHLETLTPAQARQLAINLAAKEAIESTPLADTLTANFKSVLAGSAKPASATFDLKTTTIGPDGKSTVVSETCSASPAQKEVAILGLNALKINVDDDSKPPVVNCRPLKPNGPQ